jgi:hypothetical protein
MWSGSLTVRTLLVKMDRQSSQIGSELVNRDVVFVKYSSLALGMSPTNQPVLGPLVDRFGFDN